MQAGRKDSAHPRLVDALAKPCFHDFCSRMQKPWQMVCYLLHGTDTHHFLHLIDQASLMPWSKVEGKVGCNPPCAQKAENLKYLNHSELASPNTTTEHGCSGIFQEQRCFNNCGAFCFFLQPLQANTVKLKVSLPQLPTAWLHLHCFCCSHS